MEGINPSNAALLKGLEPLLEACPSNDCNPEECPLHGVRELPRELRGEWLDGLTEDALEYLAAYCHCCLKLRIDPSKA